LIGDSVMAFVIASGKLDTGFVLYESDEDGVSWNSFAECKKVAEEYLGEPYLILELFKIEGSMNNVNSEMDNDTYSVADELEDVEFDEEDELEDEDLDEFEDEDLDDLDLDEEDLEDFEDDDFEDDEVEDDE